MMSNKLEQMCPPVIQPEIGKVPWGSASEKSFDELVHGIGILSLEI